MKATRTNFDSNFPLFHEGYEGFLKTKTKSKTGSLDSMGLKRICSEFLSGFGAKIGPDQCRTGKYGPDYFGAIFGSDLSQKLSTGQRQVRQVQFKVGYYVVVCSVAFKSFP